MDTQAIESHTLAEAQPRVGQAAHLWVDGKWQLFIYLGDMWQQAHRHYPAQPTDRWKPVTITTGQNGGQPT
jgi:hypothetical protein